MRLSETIAATVFASILFSASASRADERAAPQPGAAPQPLPELAVQKPLSGYVPPPPYYPPPYHLPEGQVPRPALVAPKVLKFNQGEMIPPGYHEGTAIRTGLVVGGAVTFATAWEPTAIVGSLFIDPVLAIPVAGPFITLAFVAHTDGGGPLFAGLLVLDGIQQAVGLGMLIAGIAAPRTVLRRDDVKTAKRWWLPTPMSFGKGSAGLGMMGTI